MKTTKNMRFANPPCLITRLTVVALLASVTTTVRAKADAVEPAATQNLKRMCDYMGGLKQFSVDTQNTMEDLLDAGHRIDVDVSARATVSRPNRIRAERIGGLFDQVFYYNGSTLTLWNPGDGVYATVSAPASIEGTLDYARDTLGLIIPASDLVYTNSYKLLMQDVTLATVVGTAMINGVECEQLLFSRPGVDFQVWIATKGNPLPHKVVITDTATPARLSLVTVMSHWNLSPPIDSRQFDFTPPEDAKSITFLPLISETDSNR